MAAKRPLLSYYSTAKITELNGAISSTSATSITLDSTEGIRVGQVLLIDDGSNSEQVTVTGITSATVITVTRHATSPQAHDTNAAVSHAPVWNNIYLRGSSSISAISNLEVIDELGVPTVAYIDLINSSGNAYSGSVFTEKGPLTDLFDDFLPVRVIDPETGFIFFSGFVTDSDDKFSWNAGGMALRLECKDYLEELKNSPSEEWSGFKIETDGTGADKYMELTRSSHAVLAKVGQKWFLNKLYYDRGGLIRSLVKLFSDNILTYSDYDYASGTLAEAVDDGASAGSETAIDVTDAAKLCIGNVIKVESEEMLITNISSNTLTVTRNVNGTTAADHDNGTGYSVLDSRYTFSEKPFNEVNGEYELGGRNQTSALAHMKSLARQEPQQSTALNAAGAKFYGYDFHVDPNFTSSLVSHKPTGQFFNYFKKGSRPSTTPLTHGLRVEYPSGVGFTPAGKLAPMDATDFDFDRAKGEVFTDAIVKYLNNSVNGDGVQIANEFNLSFELLTVKAVANAENFIWASRTLTGGTDAGLTDPTPDTTYNPEILQVKVAITALNMGGGIDDDATTVKLIFDNASGISVNDYLQIDDEIMQVDALNPDGDNANELTVDRAELGTSLASHADDAVTYDFQDIATMQYINKTSSVSDSDPAYVLISGVKRTFGNAYFAEDEVWRGKTNPTSTFTIKSRPRNKFAVNKTARLTVGENSDNKDDLREEIVAALLRTSDSVIRGRFSTFSKPYFSIDNNVGTYASSGGTDTIKTSNDTINAADPLALLDLSKYGFRTGMLVNELTAAGGVPTDTYGYAENVGTTQLKVSNWFDGGSINADSELRYYIPIRAGDLIYVKNHLANIAGNYTVTTVKYQERNGVTKTSYDVVSSSDNTKGGGARLTPVSQLTDVVGVNRNIPNREGPISTAFGTNQIITGGIFTSTSATQVAWTGFNIVSNNNVLSIGSSNTGSTMVTAGNGNAGQATDGTAALLATGVDYFIYMDVKDAQAAGNLKTIRRAAYLNVATNDTVVVAHAINNSSQADCDITIFPYQHGIPSKGRADYKLSDPAVMTSLVAGSSFNGNLDQVLIWHDSAKQWKWATPQGLATTYQQLGGNGAVGAPQYSFASDPDTGMYTDAGNLLFSVNGAAKFYHDGSTFTIVGALAKDSGTFLIDHPVYKDTKKLQHGFIEGPKYDLLYRGRAILRYGKATVDINAESNMSAGTFEALTQDPEVWVQNITGWTAVKGSVSGATLTIEAATNSSDTVAWLVIAERADEHILELENTDDEGHLIPESEKPSA
tara:strand:- start:116 stop:3964 length:3849 start_codon:yes stop_codon:yes gene_type:complete